MISVTLLVKNGERTVQKVLESLDSFNEIILIDTGSTDQTVAIAKKFLNVKIFHRPFEGFGPLRNEAAQLATNDWILALDCDEILSPDLQKEIREKSLNQDHLYSFRFQNYFNNRHIRWCGWHPESHIRLYNRKKTAFSNAQVHEGVEKRELQIESFQAPVLHYPYASISDFLRKMEHYSTLFAQQYHNKKKSSPLIALYHGVGAFVKSYLIKRGFLGGYEGFLISCYNGHVAFYKYLKLYHLNKGL